MSEDYVVYGTMLMVLRVSRLFGMAPLSLEQRGRVARATILSGYYTIYSYVILLFIVMVFVVNLYKEGEYGYENVFTSNIIHLVLKAFYMMVILSLMVIVVFSSRKRIRRLLLYTSRILEVNSKLGYDYKLDPRPMTILSFLFCSFITGMILQMKNMYVALVASKEIYTYEFAAELLLLVTSNFYIHNIYAITKTQQIVLITLLNGSVKNINRHLQNISNELQEPGKSVRTSLTAEKIRQLSLSNCKSIDILRYINKTEENVFFILYYTYTLIISYGIWCFRRGFKHESLWRQVIQVTPELIHLTDNIISILILVEPCHRIQKSIESTKAMLVQILDLVPAGGPISREVSTFLGQFLAPTYTITLCGVYAVTRQLFINTYSIVSSFLSYAAQFHLIDL